MEKKRYHNMSEEDKEKLKKYKRNYREAKKHASQNSNVSLKVCYKYMF